MAKGTYIRPYNLFSCCNVTYTWKLRAQPTSLAMTLLCLNWKGRKRNLFNEAYMRLSPMGSSPESFTFFCVCVWGSIVHPLPFSLPGVQFKAIQKCISMFLNWESWILGWKVYPKILAGVNFLLDKLFHLHLLYGNSVKQWIKKSTEQLLIGP